jgi:hypothetical protein
MGTSGGAAHDVREVGHIDPKNTGVTIQGDSGLVQADVTFFALPSDTPWLGGPVAPLHVLFP